jgi:MFS family permease
VLDKIILLATGLVAIYLIWRFVTHYRKASPRPVSDIYAIIAFAVLLVAGLLLIFFGYGILASPLVVIVAVLIPTGLAAVKRGEAVSGFLGVTVGGALIGLGGIALAFLKTGGQLLFFSAAFVFAILAPLLLCMALAFTWGYVKQLKKP